MLAVNGKTITQCVDRVLVTGHAPSVTKRTRRTIPFSAVVGANGE